MEREAQTKNKTILIIEDHPLNMKLAVDLLELAKLHVLQASDGASALKILQQQKPDLILLDIGLPDMNGLEVFQRIRAMPALQHIKIAAVSASVMRQEKERVLKMGFDAFISKPIQVSTFVQQIKALL